MTSPRRTAKKLLAPLAAALLGAALSPSVASAQPVTPDQFAVHPWIVEATSAETYVPAYLANGLIGLRSRTDGLGADRVLINGFYDRAPGSDYPRLIKNYNPTAITLTFADGKTLAFDDAVRDWKQVLDLKQATLETSYAYGDSLRVKTRLLCLRNLPTAALGVYEFEAVRDIEFTVKNAVTIPDRPAAPGIPRSTMKFAMYSLSTSIKTKIPVMSVVFPTESGTDSVAGANTFYFDGPSPELTHATSGKTGQHVSFPVRLKQGEKFSFAMLSTITHSELTGDPHADAVRLCSRDYHLGYRHLLANHRAAWEKLWESDIEIEGDAEAQRDVRLALYSLYSSIHPGFGLSIPPCGLADAGWGGHIFWDAELWMYPPLLALRPELASSMLDFRLRTLPQARNRAAQFGYAGAMYPWESDLQGNEGTPISYKLDMNEHHITADVAIAAWNYYLVTKDRRWLHEKGFPLIKDVADFWVSRAAKDAAGVYHINNVVGPDEYAEDIDDDAFTNGAAKVVFEAATKSAKLVGATPDPAWETVRAGLVVLRHPDGHTLQNAQYKGHRIKQADVNLLSFPLEYITDPAQILRDLEYYEPRIDPKGPSMSYSVLATSYARLGQAEKAYELFRKAYQPNRKPPFHLIAEKPHKDDNTVFCTGYGGILQTVIFGFAGMRIGEDGLTQGQPHLPPAWRKLTIKISGQKDLVCLPGEN